MVNSFFFPRGCKFPTAPKWPCYKYGFGGLMEFVYLDLKDPDTGEWYPNPAIFNPDEVFHVQDFRVGDVMGTDGQMHRVRGYSGWYFQAMASTAQVDVNASQQAEADPQGRENWHNLVDYWYDRPQSVDPPVHTGAEFYNLDYLWKGIPEFEGNSFVSVNSITGGGSGNPGGGSGGTTLPGGGYNDWDQGYGAYTFPGPIAMSYLYGWQGDTQWQGEGSPALNHTMRFSMAGKCKVRLHGRTPIMGDWSTGGSWLPEGENDKISIMPGQDKLIVIDGMRGIRVRTSGWFAHFGDHVIKSSHYDPNFIFWGSGNSVNWYNEGLQVSCEDEMFGQATYAYGFDQQGNITYNNVMEVAAQHHWWIGQWCDNNPNSGLDRYSLDATLKLWKKRPTDPVNSQLKQRVPDPYKVIVGTSPYSSNLLDTPADAIVYAKAQERQSVHAFDPNHETNGGDCNPDYAKSIGILFTLPETRDKYSYGHIEIKHQGHIVGSCFCRADSGYLGWSTIFNNAIKWRPTDNSIFPNYGGGLPIPSTEKDPNQEGAPMQRYDAMTIAMPFGDQNMDYLPKCGIYITTIGKTNVPYVIKSFTNIPSNIATPNSVTIDWGDGSATENATTIGTTFTHTYTAKGYYKIRITINYTMAPGITTDFVVQSGNELTHILVKDA